MVKPPRTPAARSERGSTMIEVLVTMMIIAFGLLGISGLQARLQSSEMEAYQRTQGLLLLEDLKGRIEANRLQVGPYATAAAVSAPTGAGVTCPTVSGSSTRQERDIADWCNALQGAGESKDAGATKLGAMIGARGCVEDLGTGVNGDRSVRITVAWQGMTPIVAPPEACGQNSYNGDAASPCKNDLCRRAVSTVVRIAKLSS